jgi:hypothetical protein
MGVVTIEDNTGRIDGVLFPRTWKRFNALIQNDQLLILHGKADTSRGDPQIIVDSVSVEFDHVEAVDSAPDWTPPPAQYAPPEPPSDDDMAPPPDPMFDPIPRKVIASAPPPTAPAPANGENGHNVSRTNGHTNGNGAHREPPPIDFDTLFDEESPATRVTPRLITITFLRTDDVNKDRRRISHITNELQSYPGADRFRFKIIDSEKIIYWMPDYTTEYNAQVEAFLIKNCGQDEFSVEDFTGDSA